MPTGNDLNKRIEELEMQIVELEGELALLIAEREEQGEDEEVNE